MRTDVRQAALAAALKTTRSVVGGHGALKSAVLRSGVAVGLTGALLGCYDMHAHVPQPDAAVADTSLADTPPDAPPPECDALLAGLDITVSESWGAEFTSAAAQRDPAVGACCHELELAARGGTPIVEPFTPLAFACCDVVVFEQSLETYSELGCTPWGPPCPPEMPVA